jgi:hypothetical protein
MKDMLEWLIELAKTPSAPFVGVLLLALFIKGFNLRYTSPTRDLWISAGGYSKKSHAGPTTDMPKSLKKTIKSEVVIPPSKSKAV